MKFGVFLPIATSGFVMSTTSPRIDPTYALQREITLLAEEIGFAFSMSMVKHHGFGGPSRYWDEAMDSLTTMTALAADTTRITVVPSLPMLALHPAIAARKAATLYDIAEGRFMLNVVTGWSRTEYEQYGLWPGDSHYRDRYTFADEYVGIMKEFWSTGKSNFKGKYFQMHDAECLPMPKGGDIPLVCAGQSETGMEFAARVGRYNFITGAVDELPGMQQRLQKAAATAGREVGALPAVMPIMGATDAEAEERYQHIVEGADVEAIQRLIGDAASGTGGIAQKFVEQTMFAGQTPIVGSYETVARTLQKISDTTSAEGVMFSFVDYIQDLNDFAEHVMPRLDATA